MNTPLHIIKPASFACGRTCTPGVECRFGILFRSLGRTRVISHTTKVDVELRDHAIAREAIEALGGKVREGDVHRLFSTTEKGLGFNLPGWSYPLVLRADNTLAFDDYHGSWGKVSDITKLTQAYTIAKARAVATEQGWMVDTQADGSLLIYHPDGGTVNVNADGIVEASGFVGSGCDVTTALEQALGTQSERNNKPEYYSLAIGMQV